MPAPQTPIRNLHSRNPSFSDSSEAVEDNKVESDTDKDENPHWSRWKVDLSKQLTLDSKKLKNGKYGMFSDNSPFKTRFSASKHQRSSQLTVSGKKRYRGGFDDTDQEREESPLFEPEGGSRKNNITSDDDDVVMLSPTPVARSNTRLRRRNTNFRTRDGTHRNAPIMIPDLDSESEIISSVRDTPTSKPSRRPFKAAAEAFKDSPLSGNADVLQSYLEIIEQLSEQISVRDSQMAKMHDYDKEDSQLAQNLTHIPAEQEKLNKAIADKCATAIQNDMKNLAFADFQDIEAAFQMRREEAEKEKAALPGLMLEKEVGYETRRDAIAALKAAAESELREIDGKSEELKKRKAQLELEGGCALGFELGRKAATKLNGHRKHR